MVFNQGRRCEEASSIIYPDEQEEEGRFVVGWKQKQSKNPKNFAPLAQLYVTFYVKSFLKIMVKFAGKQNL